MLNVFLENFLNQFSLVQNLIFDAFFLTNFELNLLWSGHTFGQNNYKIKIFLTGALVETTCTVYVKV